MRLSGKSAIVTGAASGIGRAIAVRFAAEGAAVLAADIDEAGARAAAEAIAAEGGRAEAYGVDVSDAAAVEAMAAAAEARLGGLDALVHSAAVAHARPALEETAEDWRRVIDVNLTGSFLCAQAAARRMAARAGGRIVLLASVNSQRAITGRVAYGASKGGVAMLTRILAAELGGHGITVNAVAPGPVETPMAQKMHTAATRRAWHDHLAIKRYATPEECASAAVFLASDEAAYVTGHLLNVDGGFEAAGMIFELERD